MAGNKGFRNLPKLERLKRGRLPPSAPLKPSPKQPFRPAKPRRASISLSALSGLHRKFILSIVELLDPAVEAYLVGGALRDLLLGRSPADDLDLAVPAGALETARALADRLQGRYVCMDEERGAARVVLTTEDGQAHVDLTDFRGATLEADLQGRDFTIDAMAVALRELAKTGEAAVHDPTGGLRDLARRRLRLAGPRAFAEDPVRALKGVRLAHALGFHLEAGVRRAAGIVSPRLGDVAPERIRDELAGILALSRAGAALRELDRLALLAVILPESIAMKSASQPLPHRFSVWEHSVRAVEAADRLLAQLGELDPYGQELAVHLGEPLGDGFTRRELLKLAALLHDVGKPRCRQLVEGRIRFFGHDLAGAQMAQEIARRLRLSNVATRALVQLVRQHLRLMHLSQVPEITRRARYRFFKDLGPEARDLLLLTLADAAAVRGVSPLEVWRAPAGRLVGDFLRGLDEEREQAAVPPLLRGGDVMASFGLAPGPEVGRLLALARESQDLGLVKTREGALAYLAGHKDDSLTAEPPAS